MSEYICDKCIGDPVLAEFIRDNAHSNRCSYCNRRPRRDIAVELSEVADEIRSVMEKFYTDELSEETWYDREEGDFYGNITDTMELVQELGLEPDDFTVVEDVVDAIGWERWIRRAYWPGPHHERASFSWANFCHIVQHERRFSFWEVEPDTWSHDYSPKQIVEYSTKVAKSTLIHKLPAGTRFWRVRTHDEKTEPLEKVKEFTSHSPEKAYQPNRMSPSGIPMFYGAELFKTACIEVVGRNYKDKKRQTVTGLKFETVAPTYVLDLTALPKPRSMFERWTEDQWDDYLFLKNFVVNLSKPIVQDGRQHIEYVPTQVFTEFIRYKLKIGKEPVLGIIYPSSYNGEKNVVIFADQDHCLPKVCKDAILRPVGRRKSVPVPIVQKWIQSL